MLTMIIEGSRDMEKSKKIMEITFLAEQVRVVSDSHGCSYELMAASPSLPGSAWMKLLTGSAMHRGLIEKGKKYKVEFSEVEDE